MGRGEKKVICMNIKSILAEVCLNSQGGKKVSVRTCDASLMLCNHIYNNKWVESWQSLNWLRQVSQKFVLVGSHKKLNVICSTVCILLLF